MHGPRRKHSLSIVGKTCLQRRCIATEVTQLLLAYSLPRQVFSESLPRNEHLFWLHYSGFQASCHNTVKLCLYFLALRDHTPQLNAMSLLKDIVAADCSRLWCSGSLKTANRGNDTDRMNRILLCSIWGPHGGDYGEFRLMGCNGVQSVSEGNVASIFRVEEWDKEETSTKLAASRGEVHGPP
jgi:hypothetical protein